MSDSSYILDVPATPAVIEWVDTDGQTRYLQDRPQRQLYDRILFDLYFNTSSNTSFSKLRIPFNTKATSKESRSIYLFIPSERVASLTTECSNVPEAVREQLGTDVIRLRFDLNKPADLVMPYFHSFPRKKFYRDTLYISATLAQQTTITIYVARPLKEEQLRPLCDAISLGSLSSSKGYADSSVLGGWVCTEIDTLIRKYGPKPLYPAQAGPSGTRQRDDTSTAVPLYAEQSSSPPTGPGSNSKTKRLRYSSDTDTGGTDDEIEGEHVLRQQVAEMFSELGRRMDSMNEEVQETKKELLETKRELQTTKLELQAAQRETKRETNRKLHATLKELLRLQTDNRETKRATKRAIGKELPELKAKMDQEALRLYRLSGQTEELLMKRQHASEELVCEAVELLKGVMQLLSQMLKRQDGGVGGGNQARTPRPPRTHAPAADLVAPPEIATTASTTGSVSARRPRVSSVTVPPPRTPPPFTTTTATTALADSSTDSDPASTTANPADSSTDIYPASPIVPSPTTDNLVPPPRTLPFPITTNNPADSSTESDPASPIIPHTTDGQVPPPRTLPFPRALPFPRTLPLPRPHPLPATINSGPASPGPTSAAILEPSLSPDEFDSYDSLDI